MRGLAIPPNAVILVTFNYFAVLNVSFQTKFILAIHLWLICISLLYMIDQNSVVES